MNSLSLITTLLLILSAAIGGGVIARRFKLPMLVGYITGGVLIGNLLPAFASRPVLDMLAEGGITLLLFTLGIEFSFHRLRKVLGTIAWAAAAQIVLTIFIFLFLFLTFGLGFLASIVFAAAASLSSTAVVVKILSEKGELETLPGEVATGWLIIQDLSVVPLMLILPAIVAVGESGASAGGISLSILASLVKSGVVVTIVVYLGRHGVPKLLSAVSQIRSRELFLLVVVGIVFFAALISYAVGLSAAVGAFLAGLLIAETSQNHAVFSEIRPLRDLFSVVFFVSLGLLLPASVMLSSWPKLLGLTVAIMTIKWFIVMGLARFMGYHRKTAFAVAISLTQMSEFGFILAKEGLGLHALTSDQYVLLVALVFLTIFVSSPIIANTHGVYNQFRGLLARFPKIFPEREETFIQTQGLPMENHVVICGYGRVGSYIGRALEMAGIQFVVVDYNSSTISSLREKGIVTVYGDPGDKDVLDYAQVDLARAVVIAIPDRHTQELVISNVHSLNRRIRIICRTHHEEDQRHLKSLGVHTIVQPEFEAALSIVEKLLTDFGVAVDDISGKVSRLKIEHGLG